MSAHTPGPWEYDGKFTVGIPHKNGQALFRTNPEDARLIAAAPELLEAAKQSLAYMTGRLPNGLQTELEVGVALDAAIAKAEGRS